MLRRRFDLEAGELQPKLRRLVDGLEEQLVAMDHLLRRLLQGEELIGAQVALVVGGALSRQDRLRVVLDLASHQPGGWNRLIVYPSGSTTSTALPHSSRIGSRTWTPPARSSSAASSTSSTWKSTCTVPDESSPTLSCTACSANRVPPWKVASTQFSSPSSGIPSRSR